MKFYFFSDSSRSLFCLLLFLAVPIVAGCSGPSSSSETSRLFSQALEEFDKANAESNETTAAEKFRQVAGVYQNLIDRGVHSGPLYYNQGNAWARAGDRGKAITAYLRAKRYMPLEPHLDANLRAVGYIKDDQATPILETILFWQNGCGYQTKYFVTVTGTLASFFFGFVTLFWLYSYKWARRTTVLLVVFAIVMNISLGYDWYRFDVKKYAVISVAESVPRKGNSERYEPAFTQPLTLGTVAERIDNRGDWYLLRFNADQEAWLPVAEIELF